MDLVAVVVEVMRLVVHAVSVEAQIAIAGGKCGVAGNDKHVISGGRRGKAVCRTVPTTPVVCLYAASCV